ncbi:MAG: hypothetical protein GXO64_02950 [Candidatus Micrarchaeota archaeon]|nr:hypothetical protein [Candidatus Micrarchaeota archaeon]
MLLFRGTLVAITIFIVVGALMAPQVIAADFWSDMMKGIEEWFRISPFRGIFGTPEKEISVVTIKFFPQSYAINPTSPYDISTSAFNVFDFAGEINYNSSSGDISFSSEGGTRIVAHLDENITITNLKIARFSMDNLELVITKGNWTEATREGSAEFTDFSGEAHIYSTYIELFGNVSKIEKR